MLESTYFSQYQNELRYVLAQDGEPGFRSPQLAALHAAAGHLLHDRRPAIITMPTGSGKTAVLAALPFALGAGRVLVLTPSQLVREQILLEFSELKDLQQELRVVRPDLERPRTVAVLSRRETPELWHDLEAADVVVGTPNCLSPALAGVCAPPEGLFDLILVDEAHHSPAKTWRALLEHFCETRQALFTATPFRRDRREIAGKFVFTYTLRQAHADGVFGKVKYRAVDSASTGRDADRDIARAAEVVLKADREAGLNHFLLVRTDQRSRASELIKIYDEHTSLNLRLLHSGHTLTHAMRVIEKLKSGEVDGVVCVDMLGEGVNIPRLKVAAIHAPHKSLAVTLQFIGRFARTTAPDVGGATFLAVPDDIEIESRHLYESDAIWQELIADLSDSRTEEEQLTREFVETFDPTAYDEDLRDLSLHSLSPQQHVKILHAPADSVDLSRAPEWIDDAEVVALAHSVDHDTLVMLTRTITGLRWSGDDRVCNVEHELFIVYLDRATDLLFISSTKRNETVYDDILDALSTTPFPPIPLAFGRLNKVLNGLTSCRFYNVGMRRWNARRRGESYRISVGSDASTVITQAIAGLYHRGHLFGTGVGKDGTETIGLSSASKVWNHRSSRIRELVEWCRQLATRIASDAEPMTGSLVDLLSAGKEVSAIPGRVLWVDWNHETYRSPWSVENPDGSLVSLLDCDLRHDESRDTPTSAGLVIDTGTREINLRFSIGGPHISVEPGESDTRVVNHNSEVTVAAYLNNYLPILYFHDLGSLQGTSHFPASSDIPSFDANRIEVVDWAAAGVDVTKECDTADSIQAYLANDLGGRYEVVYHDHGSGEAADFVCLAQSSNRVTATLLHCKKAAASVKKGATEGRVEYVYEVCGQAAKSAMWNDPLLLLRHIRRRYKDSKGVAKFLAGDENKLRQLLKNTSPSNFLLEIVVVQPGVSKSKAKEELLRVIAAADRAVQDGDCQPLRIIGGV